MTMTQPGMSFLDRYLAWVAKAEDARRGQKELEKQMLAGVGGVSVNDVDDASSAWQKAVNTATMYGIGVLIEQGRQRKIDDGL